MYTKNKWSIGVMDGIQEGKTIKCHRECNARKIKEYNNSIEIIYYEELSSNIKIGF